MYPWIRKETEPHLDEKTKNGVTWLSFPALEETGIVTHAFSTRMGGVSKGPYATMNFSFTRGDDPEAVKENYRRMADALQVDMNRMVLTWQTHTTNVRVISEADFGKGVVKDRDYRDVDGLITNIPGVTLVTFFADCVPLYFVDKKHKAIGLSHSGWRGTVRRMGEVTLKAMAREFGTEPCDVVACVGPSICQDCYEVGPEVIDQFKTAFDPCHHEKLFYEKPNGKYQLNLWEANHIVLLEAGVPEEQISVTDICTYCNPDLLFSHRRCADKRGNLCAFLSLKEN
ncbi:MAG: peptidoglycan editing factor PgeF [Lachnospiraceae bacterium]|nr:peptidoglycan editing factor PgeF [Lachnospiraceae bacterium]